jgi:outer membrane biosynthesis protein TonB
MPPIPKIGSITSVAADSQRLALLREPPEDKTGITRPVLLRSPNANYPEEARADRKQGSVTLQLIVASDWVEEPRHHDASDP